MSKETYTRYLYTRKETYKRDYLLTLLDTVEVLASAALRSAHCVKRMRQKRPTKDAYIREKRLTKETYKRICQENVFKECVKKNVSKECDEHLSKETHFGRLSVDIKRDLTKETYIYGKRPPYMKRDLRI